MASFRATLEFAGKEYDVLHSEYEFSRTTDAKGKPSSNIQGGRVSVVIESTDDTATIEAMLNRLINITSYVLIMTGRQSALPPHILFVVSRVPKIG